jgi:hypothetical protein
LTATALFSERNRPPSSSFVFNLLEVARQRLCTFGKPASSRVGGDRRHEHPDLNKRAEPSEIAALDASSGSGPKSLTRSKSGLHYPRWQTSIPAVKISRSGQFRTHALQQSGGLFHYFVGEGRGVGASRPRAFSFEVDHKLGFCGGPICTNRQLFRCRFGAI